jgi:hypothetical protein
MEYKIHIPKQLEKKLRVLAPTWYDRLNSICWNRNDLDPKDFEKLSSSYSCCFVGEIHGFTESYKIQLENNANRCDKCHGFAKDILYVTNGNTPNVKVVKFLKEVVAHCEEQHPTFFNIPVSRR